MTGFKEYGDYDGLGLADLVVRKEISPAELLDEAIDRYERVNPALNAVIRPMLDQARATLEAGPGDGPFTGVPFLLKDLIASYAGVPMMNGCRYFQDHVPDTDSELVRRFKSAGLVTFGKTNTPELGAMPVTEPELTGPTRNPWNPDHTPNGSSGGSAAAVAARVVPIASAGDGGGSIRTPASACGLVGLKPSRGRNPVGPEGGEWWWGFVVEHAVTRTVRDSAALLDATQGAIPGADFQPAPPKRPYLEETRTGPGKLRIAVSTDPILGRSIDPECVAAVEATARRLEDLGHEVESFTPTFDRDEFIYAYSILVASETATLFLASEHETGRKVRRKDLELRTWGLKRIGDQVSGGLVGACRWLTQQFARNWCRQLQDYDVFVTSTLNRPPARIGGLDPTPLERAQLQALAHLPVAKLATRPEMIVESARPMMDYTGTTMPANVTGQPSMSLPLDWSEKGLPIGTLFTGRYGDEATLFRLAAQLERAHPWIDRKPGICADA